MKVFCAHVARSTGKYLTFFCTAIALTACSSGGKSSAGNDQPLHINLYTISPDQVALAPAVISRESARPILGLVYEAFLASAADAEAVSFYRQIQLAKKDETTVTHCAVSGKITIYIRKAEKRMVFDWDDCRTDSDYKVSGVSEISFTEVADGDRLHMRVVYDAFRKDHVDFFEQQDGTIEQIFSSVSRMEYVSTINLRILRDDEAPVFLYELAIQVQGRNEHAQNNVKNLAGTYAQNGLGKIVISTLPGERTIEFSGADGLGAALRFSNSFVDLSFTDSSSTQQGAGVRLHAGRLNLSRSYINFFSRTNSAPFLTDQHDLERFEVDPVAAGWDTVDTIPNQEIIFDPLGLFGDSDADLLLHDAAVVEVSANGENDEPIPDKQISSDQYQLERRGFSKFGFSTTAPGEYVIALTATDSKVRTEARRIRIYVWADTDADGLANVSDIDDDNDGVSDSLDQLPLDPAETGDFDLDGVGDVADLDDDNDGAADAADFYPTNNLCDGAYDGDGEKCHVQYLHEWKNIYDGSRIIYFYKSASQKILRWDMQTERFIEPLVLAENSGATDTLTGVAYSPANRRLYLAHQSGRIDFLSDANIVTQAVFLDPIGQQRLMSVVGPYLFVIELPPTELPLQDPLTTQMKVEVLNSSGTIIASTTSSSSQEYRLDAVQNVVYGDGGYEGAFFDMQTLAFVSQVDQLPSPPLAESADGALSLRENGEIYDQTFAAPLGQVPFFAPGPSNRAIWLGRDILYLSPYLSLYDSSGQLLRSRELSQNIHEVLGLYADGTKAVAIVYEGYFGGTKFYRVDRWSE